MKAKHDATVGRARRAWTSAGLGLLTLALIGGVPARAASLQSTISTKINSTIQSLTGKSTSSTQPSSEAIKQLNQFLSGGPNKWSVEAPYPIPPGLKSQVVGTNGSLLNTPLAQYLVWKRDQAPAFFDKHHPGLAAAMQKNDLLRQQAEIQAVLNMITQSTQSSTTTAATSMTTSGTSTGTQAAAQTLAAQTLVSPAPVPEPASIVSALLLFGAAGGWQRRRHRTTA
jgi:hypothetical protein